MKLDEVKTSVTVALMTTVTSKDEKFKTKTWKDIEKQCQVVGEMLGGMFLQECMKLAEKNLEDGKEFDATMRKFKKIGPRFSEHIEEAYGDIAKTWEAK